jgi:diaminohydroxyphosphoribosylaminopyrimidine deaminase/5-amino-6-(5-phosphoribosylamino)uracil reductase
LVRDARRSPVLVLGHDQERRRRALARRGVAVATDTRSRGRLDLRFVLRALWERGVRSVMVEGGSEVLGSFLRARLFDEVALFRAPLLLGGRGSRAAFGGPDPLRLAEALRLEPAPVLAGAPYELWRPARGR